MEDEALRCLRLVSRLADQVTTLSEQMLTVTEHITTLYDDIAAVRRRMDQLASGARKESADAGEDHQP